MTLRFKKNFSFFQVASEKYLVSFVFQQLIFKHKELQGMHKRFTKVFLQTLVRMTYETGWFRKK
jgi:hypothetical protein